MPLTDLQIKGMKPSDKPIKLADGGGMFDRVPWIGVTAQSPFDLRRAWPVYQAAATGGRLTRGSSPIVATVSRGM